MGLVKLKMDMVTSGRMSNKTSAEMTKSNKRVEETKSSKMGKAGDDLSEERDLQLGEILNQSITRWTLSAFVNRIVITILT